MPPVTEDCSLPHPPVKFRSEESSASPASSLPPSTAVGEGPAQPTPRAKDNRDRVGSDRGEAHSGGLGLPFSTRGLNPTILKRFEALTFGFTLFLVLANTILGFLPLRDHPRVPALLLIVLFPTAAVTTLWGLNRWLVRWHNHLRVPILPAFLLLALANTLASFAVTLLFASLPSPWGYTEFTGIPMPVVAVRVTILSLLCALALWALQFARDLQREGEVNLALAKANQQAALDLLEQQVNPHFLMNALTALQGMVRQGHPEAEAYLLRLSRLYRTILQRREEATTSLREELAFLEDYLALMNLRWNGALSLVTSVPEELRERRVPSFALQLLVENAIRHNRFSRESPLAIRCEGIRGATEQLRVSNPLRRRDRPTSTQAGLRNLRERYELLGHRDSLTVQETPSTFEVTLPLLPES